MNEFKPTVTVGDGVMTLNLTPTSRASRLDFDCVIDQTDLGEIVGVEILDLVRQLGGGRAPCALLAGFPRWSYDEEIDAFYIHLAAGRAQVQKSGSCTAYVDQEGQLSALEVTVTL